MRVPTLLLAIAASAPARAAIDPAAAAFAAAPAKTLADAEVHPSFRVVALSNLAEACASEYAAGAAAEPARSCVAGALDAALGLRPLAASLGDDGMHLAHLAVIQAAAVRVGAPGVDRGLWERVCQHLAARSLSDPLATMPSFAGNRSRWPADQSVVLYALFLRDQLMPGEAPLLPAPLAAWRAVLEAEGTDPATGLWRSELRGTSASSGVPRGCATFWSVRYTAAFAPALAKEQWRRALLHFQVDLGRMTGLREWPSDREHPADVDSGPIVMGVGAAATAFGVGAARAVGDPVVARKLRAFADAAGLATRGDPTLSRLAAGPLAVAIRWNGEAGGRWWEAAEG